MYTTLDTLSSKSEVNKSLIAEFDIILQHGIKSTEVSLINEKKKHAGLKDGTMAIRVGWVCWYLMAFSAQIGYIM